jgi:hypothetical protein
MTDKTFIFKFVVATTIAIALGIMISPSVVKYFLSTDQARAKRSVASQIAELPNPQLSRVRLLVSTMR